MKVELISWTPNALELLLYTKNTRLAGEESLTSISMWPWEKKMEHLAYMRDTIQSSWEFVDYTFKISEVTRAFTHQLVRTRTACYAQESQRTVDVRDAGWLTPPSLDFDSSLDFNVSCQDSFHHYQLLVDAGASPQEARGLLPTNALTSIIMKVSLRTLSQMAETRLCARTQGEYQDVMRKIIELVHQVHPWIKDHEFIDVYCVKHGTCAFPRYTECPFQVHTFHGPELDQRKAIIKSLFDSERHEATPKNTKKAKTE
jgi:flavin-dependent thymidylate synthase